MLWQQLANSSDPAFMDLVFAAARLDLDGAPTTSRAEATAVAFLARAR
jgi:hypothetical protein